MGQSFTLTSVTTRRATRRALTAGAVAAGAAVALGRGVSAQSTPQASPIAEIGSSGKRYLFVGDRTQASVEVYSIPGFVLAGVVEGVTFGTHGGTLQLADGRIVFADTGNSEIVALAVGDDGMPGITDRVAGEFGGGIAWMAASPSFSHVALGSIQDSETSQFLNIVDLDTFENIAVEFELNQPEEITAWLLNDPLNLYVAVGGQIKSYLLSDLLAGNLEPLDMVEVELGSHGGATDNVNGRIFLTTAPGTGFEVLDVANGAAEYLTQIPWDVDGFTGGRNARPRVTGDGQHIFGLLTPGLDDPTLWAETLVTNHVTDMAGLSAARVEIGRGNFGYRWGISDRYALWAGYDGEAGTAYLIDADADSETFGRATATVAIPRPSNAAVAGEDFEGADTYATAITSDSKYGFVSINGDQIVKVYDLESLTEIAEFEVGLPLKNYDGYITVIEHGQSPVDIWGR